MQVFVDKSAKNMNKILWIKKLAVLLQSIF